MNGFAFFLWIEPGLRPTFAFVSWAAIRKIAHLAFLFIVLNLAVALAFQSDNLIITRLLGPEAVAQYSVPQKLFSVISLGVATLVEPLWPAYGEAIARGDGEWARRTLIRSVAISLCLASLGGGLFVLIGPKVIHLWVGDKIHARMLLLVGLACWTVLQAGGNAVAMFLNGASVIRAQVIIAGVFAIGALVVKIALVRHMGIAGMPWATLTSYFVLTVVPYLVIVPRLASAVGQPITRWPAGGQDDSAKEGVCS